MSILKDHPAYKKEIKLDIQTLAGFAKDVVSGYDDEPVTVSVIYDKGPLLKEYNVNLCCPGYENRHLMLSEGEADALIAILTQARKQEVPF